MQMDKIRMEAIEGLQQTRRQNKREPRLAEGSNLHTGYRHRGPAGDLDQEHGLTRCRELFGQVVHDFIHTVGAVGVAATVQEVRYTHKAFTAQNQPLQVSGPTRFSAGVTDATSTAR
jgi:hypothetical protein